MGLFQGLLAVAKRKEFQTHMAVPTLVDGAQKGGIVQFPADEFMAAGNARAMKMSHLAGLSRKDRRKAALKQ